MLHQYIYIVQPNTDENGWQYRSSWSDGIITSRDEQWVESPYHDTNHDLRVRRRCLAVLSVCHEFHKLYLFRLWMTTVVRKDEFIRAKKAMVDNLTGSRGDVILQGVLYKYQPDGAGYLMNSSDLAASSQLPFSPFPFLAV